MARHTHILVVEDEERWREFEPMPSPRAFNPSVPAEMEAIILVATHKDRSQRYRTVAEMRQALQALRTEAATMGASSEPQPNASAEAPQAGALSYVGTMQASTVGQLLLGKTQCESPFAHSFAE